MSYSDKLKDPRWQQKRLQILERDKWCCVKCGLGNRTLHVHHFYYKRGAAPWDYPNEHLTTLCFFCHEEVQQIQTKLLLSIIEIGGVEFLDYIDNSFLIENIYKEFQAEKHQIKELLNG